MKKRNGIGRALNVISFDVLQQLPTKALLARLQRLRWCEESQNCSDIPSVEINALSSGVILFKNTKNWKEAHWDIKTILATREHIDSN